MRTSIKIIKRSAELEAQATVEPSNGRAAENMTREVVSTVKSWIAELKDRKRSEHLSFASPVVAPPNHR